MKINLYYVEGISRIDTPSFNTKTHTGTIEDQEEFFLTKLVKSIDSTFYPPYYRNSIKFDQTDLVITDNVNYLSLEYNEKTYYYFIDKIDYTSTGIITLEVSMDTIQTFMFDIYISSALIRRKFINRWINIGTVNNPEYIINRHYCRENISEGIFQLVKKDFFTRYEDATDNDVGSVGNIYGIFVIQATDTLDGDTPTGLFRRSETIYGLSFSSLSNTRKQTMQYATYIIPLIYNVDAVSLISGNTRVACNYDLVFNEVLRDPKVINAYFIPCDNKGLFTKQTGDNVFTATATGIDAIEYNHNGGCGLFAVHQDISCYPLVKTFNHEFVRNYTKNQPYNSNFMNMLLDENYLRYEYGEGTQLSTVPVYYQCFSTIGLVYESTVSKGNRSYNIVLNYGIQKTKLSNIIDTNDNYYGTPDMFNTSVACNDAIRLDILTDAYKEWIIYNKASIPMAYVSTIANCFTYGMMNGNNESIHKTYTTSTTGERYHGFPVKKKTHFAYTTTKSVSDDVRYAPTRAETLGSIASSQWNALFAPSSVRFSGDYLSSLQNHSLQISFNKHIVNDYDKCGKYYHRNGYLVNEYITHIENIFSYVKNRYYFDLIQGEEFEVHLHNVIEDEETVTEIEERFETGLRLWNVKNSDVIMGDFTYDNVELDYLS